MQKKSNLPLLFFHFLHPFFLYIFFCKKKQSGKKWVVCQDFVLFLLRKKAEKQKKWQQSCQRRRRAKKTFSKLTMLKFFDFFQTLTFFFRDDRIRTCDTMLPKHMRYQAALHPVFIFEPCFAPLFGFQKGAKKEISKKTFIKKRKKAFW